MRITLRTLSAVVFAAVLLLAASGCKKKAPVAAAPAPPKPVIDGPPPPPPKVQAPRIDTFVAEPTSIQQGQSATLRWAIANATTMNINQNIGAVPANGTRQVFPGATTTYTLTVSNAAGMDSRSVTVNVTV